MLKHQDVLLRKSSQEQSIQIYLFFTQYMLMCKRRVIAFGNANKERYWCAAFWIMKPLPPWRWTNIVITKKGCRAFGRNQFSTSATLILICHKRDHSTKTWYKLRKLLLLFRVRRDICILVLLLKLDNWVFFSELNSIESTESIEFVEDYFFSFSNLLKLIFYRIYRICRRLYFSHFHFKSRNSFLQIL